jgi:hypothetical protein
LFNVSKNPVRHFTSTFQTPATRSTQVNDRFPKTPNDSFIEKVLHFSTNKQLRNSYINHFGHLRVGLILEDLDRLAGAIAYKHVLGEEKEVVAALAQSDAHFSRFLIYINHFSSDSERND